MSTADETSTAASATADASAAALPSLWRNRPYLLLMTGKTTQIIGAGVASFSVPLIAFSITHSVLFSGLISGVGEVGALLATLPAGVVADRVDRRRLLIWCAVIGLLLWSSLAAAAALHALTPWHLAAVLFGSTIIGTVFAPAESAGIRQVVPPAQLGSAMAAMQGRGAVASLVSGPLGGLLYGIAMFAPILANAIGYAVAAGATALVRVPLNGDLTVAHKTHPAHQLVEGLRFMWTVPVLRAGLFLFSIVNLGFGGLLVALNLHLVQLHTAPIKIGLIDAVAGAVMVVGSIAASWLVTRFAVGPLLIAAMVPLVGGGTIMAVANGFTGYLIGIAVACLLVPAINAGLGGYVSAITPPQLQGRMFAALSLSAIAVQPLAPIIAGALLSVWNVHAAMLAFAALLAIGTLLMLASRSVRRIGRPDTWAEDVAEGATVSG